MVYLFRVLYKNQVYKVLAVRRNSQVKMYQLKRDEANVTELIWAPAAECEILETDNEDTVA